MERRPCFLRRRRLRVRVVRSMTRRSPRAEMEVGWVFATPTRMLNCVERMPKGSKAWSQRRVTARAPLRKLKEPQEPVPLRLSPEARAGMGETPILTCIYISDITCVQSFVNRAAGWPELHALSEWSNQIACRNLFPTQGEDHEHGAAVGARQNRCGEVSDSLCALRSVPTGRETAGPSEEWRAAAPAGKGLPGAGHIAGAARRNRDPRRAAGALVGFGHPREFRCEREYHGQ